MIKALFGCGRISSSNLTVQMHWLEIFVSLALIQKTLSMTTAVLHLHLENSSRKIRMLIG